MHSFPEKMKATTFAVIIGTGGYMMPAVVVATNDVSPIDSEAVDNQENNSLEQSFNKVAQIEKDYGLGRDQLAELLNVSRPTVYSWLNRSAGSIRNTNKDRIDLVAAALEVVNPELRKDLGKLLRHSLDLRVQETVKTLASGDWQQDQLEDLGKIVNFKLEGLQRSSLLSKKLANSARLIS